MAEQAVRWMTIVAGTYDRSVVERYLYGATKLIQTYTDGYGDVYVAVTIDTDSSRPNAQYYAQYQADRFASGMIPATVYETFDAAQTAARDAAAVLNHREVLS
jgi:hypothetical protein